MGIWLQATQIRTKSICRGKRELLQEKQQNLLKNLASFLNKTFLNNNGLDNFFKIAYATKFYKKVKVNKELLASYLQEQNNNPESIIITSN